MYKISKEWIDKIFHCFELFYGERFTKSELENTRWQSGLYNLSYDEIKQALAYCKWSAQNYNAKPPTCIEFYQLAKRTNKVASPKALNAIHEIREKLGLKKVKVLHGTNST